MPVSAAYVNTIHGIIPTYNQVVALLERWDGGKENIQFPTTDDLLSQHATRNLQRATRNACLPLLATILKNSLPGSVLWIQGNIAVFQVMWYLR
jgi:hypothetical protein